MLFDNKQGDKIYPWQDNKGFLDMISKKTVYNKKAPQKYRGFAPLAESFSNPFAADV